MIQLTSFPQVQKIINEKKDVKQKVVDKATGKQTYVPVTYVKFMFKSLFDVINHIQKGDIYFDEKR